ncbi:MAG TPA: hypothetical protein VIM65_04950 [Cyclobacteriaceae bacterium]
MERLSKDWLTQGLIDAEYKQYLLLAYLKTVKDSFRRNELYPFMADLVAHYRNLLSVKENKALIRESFPKEISLDEIKKLELSYRQLVDDDEVMKQLESIIEFSIPRIKNSLQEGSVIFELVESKCEIAPIGVTPLYAKEGYLFVSQPPESETQVYRYQMSIFEDSNEQLRSLNTSFVDSFERSISNTYERIKLDLVKRYKDLPNPATYLILSRMRFPFTETLMPVAKRLFVKHISKA